MKKNYYFAIIGFTVFLFSTLLFAKPIIIRSMQIKNNVNACTVVIHLSAPTQYRTLTMHQPSRFIVDLKNVRTLYPLHFKGCPRSVVKEFRYASYSNHIFRMVFLLTEFQIPVVKILSDHASLQVIFSKTSTTTHSVESAFDTNTQHHRDIVVVIDPGHGGKDPGAAGIDGAKEKNIVLSISRILQKDINQQPGFRAMLTRTDDYYLTLRQRLAIARKDNAALFIAIHADKWKNTQAHGVSIFALSEKGATNEAARWLAKRENASELMGGVNLNDQSHLLKSVLINLSQSATIRSSLLLGQDIIQQVKPIACLHHDRVEQAAFVVLKSPDIPSLLIETGFLSNPSEEQRLANHLYQQKLAMSIMSGIRQYYLTHPL